jgi:Bacterial regulatory proteins, luxR family
MAAARGEHKQARAALRDDLARTAGHDDMALHLELAARAISVEADALDQARLNGRRADPVAARAAATQIMSSAVATTVRVVAAGGRLSPPLALLQAVAKAHLSRIPGPGNPELWAQIADDDLAGPYLVGIAPLPGRRRAARQPRQPTPRHHRPSCSRHHRSGPAGRPTARRNRGACPRGTHRPRPGRRHAQPPSRSHWRRPDPTRTRSTRPARQRPVQRPHRQHLYISEKTASVHVSNILRKLGVTSRVQAATTANKLKL